MNPNSPLLDDDLLALLMADEEAAPSFASGSIDLGPVPLSYAQQRLWFLQRFAPESSAYNLPRALELKGELDAEVLEQALNKVIDRHDILRTRFEEVDGVPMQRVDHQARLALVRIDLSELAAAAQNLDQRIAEEASQPFDLSQAPLIRGSLLKLGAQRHVLLLTLHHIVSDAWSNPILIHDLGMAYALASEGEATPLPRPEAQYADYAQWQRKVYLSSELKAASGKYWQHRLGGEIIPLALPTDRPRLANQAHPAAYHHLVLPGDLVQGIDRLCSEHRLTPMVVLLGAWQLLLARYSGQADFTVGLPNATRNQAETQELVGLFVTSQIIRAQVQPAQPVLDYLRGLRQQTLAALEHADYPFELILEELQLNRSRQANPAFQTMFNWSVAQDGPAGELRLGELEVRFLESALNEAKFDISLDVTYSPQQVDASFQYSATLYDAATLARMGQHWANLLGGLVAQPQQPVGELAMLSVEEAGRTLRGWNATEQAWADEAPVQVLFERQVQARPEQVALLFGDSVLSYAQLNVRANQLAHQLIELGVGPEVIVGIAAERSLKMVVGLMAILKAGGAYVPLDPEYPQDRLSYMFEDSGIDLLLTQEHLLGGLPAFAGRTLLLESDFSRFSSDNPDVPVVAENLAYVIYTSGSTGKPKGAGNRHTALHNRLAWMQSAYPLDNSDTVLQKTPFSFDVSVWEFFWPLMTGARLAIAAPGEHREPEKLIATIQRHNVTTLHFVPSMLQVFIHEPGVERCTSLKQIMCSGEALQVDAQQQVFTRLPNAGLYNLYGPTEAAIDVTHWTCRDEGVDTVPIGEPIANLYTHILDASLNPVPQGATGELVLGGLGLARGYHRRPALTAERFIPDPHAEVPGSRLYRTGDLAKYRETGVIEYQGRIDHQVKIRGLRIELGEIEARLLEQEAVKEAVVLAVEGVGGLQLVAYIVPVVFDDDASAQGVLRDALKAELKTHLPDYMVPAHMLCLAQLPVTPNGKLDRRALPAPEATGSQATYIAPATELEQAVAQIWQEVLKTGPVGRADNFFDMGGHSLLATQMAARARQRLNLEVSLRALFEHPRLDAFTATLAPSPSSEAPRLAALTRGMPLPASFAQQRQWFIWQMDRHSTAYHIRQAVKLAGEADIDALAHSFTALVSRHEALRTRFMLQGKDLLQVIEPPAPVAIDIRPCTASTESSIATSLLEQLAGVPFNLETGPLLRVGLARNDEGGGVLIMVFHHIICDGGSLEIIRKELLQGYEEFRRRRPQLDTPKPLDYADYCAWQRHWFASPAKQAQADYWTARIGDPDQVLDLPTDRPRASLRSQLGASVTCEISTHLHNKVAALAKSGNATAFMVYLSAFQALLHRYSCQSSVRVGIPTSGRSLLETETMVGLFVNTQVMCSTLSADMSFDQLLAATRQSALEAQDHQELPFDALVEALKPRRSASYHPLFQAFFNYQVATAQGGKALSVDAPAITEWALEGSTTHFDLELTLFETPGHTSAIFTYACDLFDASTIERMAMHWVNLLEAALSTPATAIERLSMLSEQEREQSLHQWNAATLADEDCSLICDRLAARFEQPCVSAAIVDGHDELSYAALNTRITALAQLLAERGVGLESRVAIAMPRSIDMVVALFATLKAGGTYVPLDLNYPTERLNYILQDSGAGFLLASDAGVLERFDDHPAQGLIVYDAAACLANPRADISFVQPGRQNLAYIIYTSGSTGRPKGVAITHGNLAALAAWSTTVYSAEQINGVLASTSICFDLSVWEILVTLANGGKIILANNALEVPTLPARDQITLINTVPSAIAALSRQDAIGPSVKTINLAGEPLKQSLVDELYAHGHISHVYDLYGPSEDTTYSTCSLRTAKGAATIGRPLPSTQAYVLNDALMPLPIGLTGELYLAGAGVARGYLNRPGLTAERFVPNPMGSGGDRMYRTGDLARFTSEGTLTYQGRKDHQVKLRGFRIELPEIEARLMEQANVHECAVLVQQAQAAPVLVAYVVSHGTYPHDADQVAQTLRSQLAGSLPDYMVPARIILLPALPLTPNGKLDRNALPPLDAQQPGVRKTPPRTAFEKAMAQVWAEVLDLPSISVDDNFFELGGSSISAMLVASLSKATFGLSVSLHDLMTAQTISALARLEHSRPAQSAVIVAMNAPGPQERLFCIHPVGGSPYCYYPLAMALSGIRAVRGVVFPDLVQGAAPIDSWSTLIALYAEAIAADAQGSDIQLLGWSLGGSIALEVAASLEAAGHRVSFLGLLDATTPQGCQWNATHQEENDAQSELEPPPHLLMVLIDYIKVLFPSHAGDAARYYQERAPRLGDEAAERQAFIAWCCQQMAIQPVQAESIVQHIEADHLQGNQRGVYRKLNDLSTAHCRRPIDVEPVCWWPAQEKSDEVIGQLISELAQLTPNGHLAHNISLPTRHNAMAYAPEFIQSVVQLMQNPTRGPYCE